MCTRAAALLALSLLIVSDTAAGAIGGTEQGVELRELAEDLRRGESGLLCADKYNMFVSLFSFLSL